MGNAIASMTGFARVDDVRESQRWTFELKSVNSRGLELRFRLPAGMDALEPALRAATQKKIARGSIQVSLKTGVEETQTRLAINDLALEDVLLAMDQVRGRVECAQPRAESILALRGVLELAANEMDASEREAFFAALSISFDKALNDLVKAREAEGREIAVILNERIDAVENLTLAAREHAAATPTALKERLARQLSELIADGAIPEERLAQEAAMLAVKADIREELDRLVAHILAARALLKRGGAIGREFDFLTQEFNREANTLCSKVQDMELKSIGLELKKTIDQIREQVQNVE